METPQPQQPLTAGWLERLSRYQRRYRVMLVAPEPKACPDCQEYRGEPHAEGCPRLAGGELVR